MVPAASHRISRARWYSGYCRLILDFVYETFTPYGMSSQNISTINYQCLPQSTTPDVLLHQVWPLSISLAATLEIDFYFSSSGYLYVSVHRVPFHTLWIGVWIHEVFSCGFPHSDICGSRNICFSPQLFAAYHVFLRLLVPRHPPCALFCLTSFASVSIALETGSLRFSTLYQLLTLIFGLLQTYVCFSDVLIKIFLSISV